MKILNKFFKKLGVFQQEQKKRKTIVGNKRPKLVYISPTIDADLEKLSPYYSIDRVIIQGSKFEKSKEENTLEWFETHFHEYEGRVLYPIRNLSDYADIPAILERFPGVVILHDFFLNKLVMDKAGKANRLAKTLYVSHGYEALLKKADYPLNFSVLRYASGIISTSSSLREQIQNWYGNEALLAYHVIAHFSVEKYVESLEYFAENSVLQRQIRSMQCATIKRKRYLFNLSQSLIDNNPPFHQKQLLYDVSILVRHDAKSGIQRVVRGYMNELLKNPPKGYRFEPIYRDPLKEKYYYARSFTAELLNYSQVDLTDQIMEIYSGDIFLSIDLVAEELEKRQKEYQLWRNKGVLLYFMLYDLLPILQPEYFVTDLANSVSHWLEAMTAVADGCVCISRTVAEEFRDWLSVTQPKRVSTFHVGWAHLGADIQESFPSTGVSEGHTSVMMRSIARLSILTIGTVEPRKGHAQALEAFEALWKQGLEVNWIIVGKGGWKVEMLLEKLKNHPQRDQHLFWFEEASDEMLLSLYKQASGCLMPSYGEGFGLPLIEAAQHKTPILARDIPVFREVGKESATYFSADSSSELMESLLVWIEQLKENKAISSECMPWMTWTQSTQKLLDVILQEQWFFSWKSE
jgi:glycosyltransferase involved in cell wall biosynthesis